MTGGIAGLLREQARRHPDRELLRFDADRSSFTLVEVDELTDRIGAVLAALGVGVGDRVAVQARNTATLPMVWFAAAKIGAVVVPVNSGYRSQDLLHVLVDSGASLLVVDDELHDSASGASGSAPELREVLAASRLMQLARTAGRPPMVEVDDDTLLNLQYTSGTTGLPKACMLTQGYWRLLGSVAAEALAVREGDVVLTAQALSYLDPQWNLALCLHAGVPLVVLPRFSASSFWESVVEHDVSVFYVIGTMALMMLRQPPSPADHLHRVRVVACSGIPPELHASLEQRWGAPWREAFGMTETGVDLIVALDDVDSIGTGGLGEAVATKRVRVVSPDGSEASMGVAGELVVSGQPMMRGYWNRPVDTAQALRGGWFHTGDLAATGLDGRLRLVGRLKDMVRRGGENIAASEVEHALATHPDVVSVAVIAVPDEVRGEEAAAVVCMRATVPHDAAAAAALRQQVRDRLAEFKVPRYVVFADRLPMTSSEKVAKHQLVADWERLALAADDGDAVAGGAHR